jgi:hypothetical protein
MKVLINSVPEKGSELRRIGATHTRALKEPTGLQLVKGTVLHFPVYHFNPFFTLKGLL